jgi:hypothetical protein
MDIPRARLFKFSYLRSPKLVIRQCGKLRQVVGGSNPSGRTKINGLDAMFFRSCAIDSIQ